MVVPGHRPTSVVVATSSRLIGDGLVSLLADVDDVDVVGRTVDCTGLLGLVDESHPDTAIVSVRYPDAATSGTISVVCQLRAEHPRLGIVIISDHHEGDTFEALRGGASGVAYLLDQHVLNVGIVLEALREVCTGQSVLDVTVVDTLVSHYEGVPAGRLAHREPEVLALMASGFSNRAIATELNISIKAIEKDITAIFRKLGLGDRTLVDRRVTAALWFLRGQADPFGPVPLPAPVVSAPRRPLGW